MTEEDILMNIYKSITTDHELKPGHFFNISGSIRLEGNIKAAVYSDDHGTHFHVLYPPDNIDARFSWPTIEIEDYKSKNEFRSKQLKNIRTMCSNPEVQVFLQREFDKRIA
jgi:methylthioribose-1-phosphate isomerase